MEPCYWPFVRGIYRLPVKSPHKSQWREALKFSLICAWMKFWVNNREAGDLRRHRAHYDVTVMFRLCFLEMLERVYASSYIIHTHLETPRQHSIRLYWHRNPL